MNGLGAFQSTVKGEKAVPCLYLSMRCFGSSMTMKDSVYLETSVVSYFTSRPSNDILIVARQRITAQWWRQALPRFDAFVSEAVIEEAADGDKGAAARRLSALQGFPLLDIDDEVERVYEVLIDRLEIPRKALRDAVHLAVASVHAIDYLVTWNCAHIANGEVIRKLIRINTELGISTPIIVTPDELMGVDRQC